MSEPEVVLRAVRPSDEELARAAQTALAADGFDFGLWADGEPWLAYLDRLDREHRGLDLPPGRVPMTFLYAEVDGRVVGRTSIRHTLTATLCVQGGHVGYAVLPDERRRGYATAILRQSVAHLRERGVGPVLVTCAADNPASLAVIRNNGGRADTSWPSSRPHGDHVAETLRFWID
ncbi:GNAT family N-acetyltransferase [Actinomycetospora sp. C-140]